MQHHQQHARRQSFNSVSAYTPNQNQAIFPFAVNQLTYPTAPQFNPTITSPQYTIQPQFQYGPGRTTDPPVFNPFGPAPSYWPASSGTSPPVGANPTDEFILTTTLRAYTKAQGKTSMDYKAALESLHGVSFFSNCLL